MVSSGIVRPSRPIDSAPRWVRPEPRRLPVVETSAAAERLAGGVCEPGWGL